ncbi:MAG: hypothetical protein IT521_02700 [Burkholderiales bacterium]|nr:hypothetical protein [Burkholderiales bacterium]
MATASNPKCRQLASALIKRFPAEVGGLGEVDESWVESRPDGCTDTRVYSLGPYDGGVTQLLPVLADEASALGLTVYDDQAACVRQRMAVYPATFSRLHRTLVWLRVKPECVFRRNVTEASDG